MQWQCPRILIKSGTLLSTALLSWLLDSGWPHLQFSTLPNGLFGFLPAIFPHLSRIELKGAVTGIRQSEDRRVANHMTRIGELAETDLDL